MNANYVYLISSLPMLHFNGKPPLPFGRFINLCERFVSQKSLNLLKSVSINGEYDCRVKQPTLRSWYEFDTTLRNELAKIRSGRRRIDPNKYLRRDGYAQMPIVHLAINAQRNPSVIEAEKMLDLERWRMLEEFCFGHYFDLDFLLIYALKLLILERWERASSADKNRLLEEALA